MSRERPGVGGGGEEEEKEGRVKRKEEGREKRSFGAAKVSTKGVCKAPD